MNHVVYNDCQGEFSLSRDSLAWLAERGVARAYKILNETQDKPGVTIDAAMIGLDRHSAILALCISE